MFVFRFPVVVALQFILHRIRISFLRQAANLWLGCKQSYVSDCRWMFAGSDDTELDPFDLLSEYIV